MRRSLLSENEAYVDVCELCILCLVCVYVVIMFILHLCIWMKSLVSRIKHQWKVMIGDP